MTGLRRSLLLLLVALTAGAIAFAAGASAAPRLDPGIAPPHADIDLDQEIASAEPPRGVSVEPDLAEPETAAATYEAAQIAIEQARVAFIERREPELGWRAARLKLLAPDSIAYRRERSELRMRQATIQWRGALAAWRYQVLRHRLDGASAAVVLVRRSRRVVRAAEDGSLSVVEEQTHVDLHVRRVGQVWQVVDEADPQTAFPDRESPVETRPLTEPVAARPVPSGLVGPSEREVGTARRLVQAYLECTRELLAAAAPAEDELLFERQAAVYLLQWFAPIDPNAAANDWPLCRVLRKETPYLLAWLDARIEHHDSLTRFAFAPQPIPDGYPFAGRIDDVRVSRTARYSGQFDPPVSFSATEPDLDTLCQFAFNERDGVFTFDDTNARFRAGFKVGEDPDTGEPLGDPGIWWIEDFETQRIALRFTGEAGSGVEVESTLIKTSRETRDTLHPRDALTVEAWVYADLPDLGTPQTILAKWGDWSADPTAHVSGYRLLLDTEGKPTFQFASADRVVTLTASARIPARTWVHIAACFARRDAARLFVDGLPVAEQALPRDGGDGEEPFDRILDSPRPLCFGATALPPVPPQAQELAGDDGTTRRVWIAYVPVDGYYLEESYGDDDDAPTLTFSPTRLQQAFPDDERMNTAQFVVERSTRGGLAIHQVRLPALGE